MNTRTVSLNHPAVSPEKLAGRKAVGADGRVGTLTVSGPGSLCLVFAGGMGTAVGPLVRLVVEES